jgi:hypothetical protein
MAFAPAAHALKDAVKLDADADQLTALWPPVHPLALSALFISSTMFTESISRGKYPDYAVYRSRVGEFLKIMLRGGDTDLRVS